MSKSLSNAKLIDTLEVSGEELVRLKKEVDELRKTSNQI
jgi:hypothetical protein